MVNELELLTEKDMLEFDKKNELPTLTVDTFKYSLDIEKSSFFITLLLRTIVEYHIIW